MNEDQVQSFHSGRVSGCVTLQVPNPASSTCSRNSPVRMASATSPICTIRVFVIVSLQEEVGRPGGTRTPNKRFWRPPLYHWSYWPRLLGLFVIGVLAAAGAELREDELVRHRPLVLGGGVVPLPADRALERDDRAVHRRPRAAWVLEPTIRIELMT